MKALIKNFIERQLARSRIPEIGLRLRANDIVILAYHNVVPNDQSGIGDASLHLSLSKFREQLDLLIRTHEVVSLDTLFDPQPARGAPRVVLTFDDGYRGAVTLGVRELVERQLPATIFVSPGLLGTDGFWWDLLSDPDLRRLDAAIRQEGVQQQAGRQQAVRSWARRRGIAERELPLTHQPASREEILAAAAHPGISIGSHTWSHPNLPCLDRTALENELIRARDWLDDHLVETSRMLAYPYGLHNPRVRRIAEAVGHAGAVTLNPGWVAPPVEGWFSQPRINIPSGLSIDGFQLRVSGISLP